MITEQWTLGTKNAVGINMASKVRSRLKFLSPHVDEKVFKSLQKRISPRKTSKALESVKGGSRERVEDAVQKILLYIVNLLVGYQQAYAARSMYYCFLKGRLFCKLQ